ncbi:MAG: electron transfer flavoprotein subunit beta/FixA family protein, partial [Myxococcales bacterium]|nr:electron transfer flavoprotein subunit beta/FixA family protein [Myxococcales bacterium]
ADRGILVEADDAALDSTVVANVLKAIVDKEKPDVVLMGKRSADSESNATGQMLAEYLGWPQGTDAMHMATTDGGKTFEIGREVDGGVLTIRVTAPTVITVADRIVRPDGVSNGVTPADHKYPESDSGRYASLKGIMAAKKKPVEVLPLAGLGVEAAPTTSHSNFSLPPARSGQTQFVPDVATLVQKLHTEAKVI